MDKYTPETKCWFDLYIELKSQLEMRIFNLEQRVKELEEEPKIIYGPAKIG